MTEMFGEAWSPMSVPDLAPDDDDDVSVKYLLPNNNSRNSMSALKNIAREKYKTR